MVSKWHQETPANKQSETQLCLFVFQLKKVSRPETPKPESLSQATVSPSGFVGVVVALPLSYTHTTKKWKKVNVTNDNKVCQVVVEQNEVRTCCCLLCGTFCRTKGARDTLGARELSRRQARKARVVFRSRTVKNQPH